MPEKVIEAQAVSLWEKGGEPGVSRRPADRTGLPVGAGVDLEQEAVQGRWSEMGALALAMAVTVVLAIAVLRERVTRWQVLGMVAAIAAIAILRTLLRS